MKSSSSRQFSPSKNLGSINNLIIHFVLINSNVIDVFAFTEILADKPVSITLSMFCGHMQTSRLLH